MTRLRITAIAAALAAAVALGIGLSVAFSGEPSSRPATDSTGMASYAYYRSVMGRFGAGPMMGGTDHGWMLGRSGYAWMMGGADAPGWMRGDSLPGFMMGGSTDPGEVMGGLFADAPGPRVSPADAARLGDETPAGATVDAAAKRVVFTSHDVTVPVLASPSMPDESFRIAGLVDPTVVVPAGARVSIELVNADTDMAHGLVITASDAASSWMPMMTAGPAFPGSALWLLGNPTSAGMHAGTLTFTATTPGTYRYLCPVPGHAEEGMIGTFIVR